MPSTTISVKDPVIEPFLEYDEETYDSITGFRPVQTRKVDNVSQSLHEEIDSLFEESGDVKSETIDEGIQTEIESHEAPDSKSHLANEKRIKLLARKYIRTLSNEEDARLEILCERVRQLFPRATSDDFVQLEKIGTELEDLEEENKKIREKYNLD